MKLPESPSRVRPDALVAWRGQRNNPGTGYLADPFAVNPIRRSFALVSISLIAIVGPWLVSEDAGTLAMLSVGWLAVSGVVMGTPVLLWSLVEEGWRRARQRWRPGVEELGLSPRVTHILLRHGYETIAEIDQTPDEALLLLSNMDKRGVRELRRAIALWKYRRWQESGFAATAD